MNENFSTTEGLKQRHNYFINVCLFTYLTIAYNSTVWPYFNTLHNITENLECKRPSVSVTNCVLFIFF